MKTKYGIAVVDRGFVYVGELVVDEKFTVITNARNIRRYGTERGLGQLALSGPTSETILDDCGTVRVPAHAMISILDTEASLWKRS